MVLHRTIATFLLSLIPALAPIVSLAMAKPCTMTSEMSEDGAAAAWYESTIRPGLQATVGRGS